MSINISDLFTRKRLIIVRPDNSNEVEQSHKELIQQLDMGGKIIDLPDKENQEKLKTGSIEDLPEGISLKDRAILSSYSLIGDALRKANVTDPVQARILISKALQNQQPVKRPIDDKSISIDGKKINFDYAKASEKIVKMKSYLFSDASDAIGAAINLGTDILGHALSTGDKRYRTKYELINLVLNNPLMSNEITGGLGRLALGLSTGSDNFLDLEFDKSRQSPHLPKHKIVSANGKEPKDFNSKVSFYELEKPKTDLSSRGNLRDTMKNIATDIAKNVLGATDGDTELIPAKQILYNTLKLKENNLIKNKYFNFTDPYSLTEVDKNIDTIGKMQGWLKEYGYLSGYNDLAGFEIGSDHQWRIQIYPYPHEEIDIEAFGRMGRTSCTPGLPYYYLPNFWDTNKLRITGSTKDYKHDFDFLGESRKLETDHYVTAPIAATKPNDVDAYHLDENLGSLFSYSDYTPVLNYDLNIGTLKTESLRLFNGSQVEIFAGMTYNVTMNMSILDDAYGSMYKYMQYYINCVYDMQEQGLAAYYSCAFQINLIIFRSAYKIKHEFKLIGVPIEYTPRLSGSQDANESRIDITFGIIGFIPPRKNFTTNSFIESNRVGKNPDSNKIWTNTNEIKWSDIGLRIGKMYD